MRRKSLQNIIVSLIVFTLIFSVVAFILAKTHKIESLRRDYESAQITDEERRSKFEDDGKAAMTMKAWGGGSKIQGNFNNSDAQGEPIEFLPLISPYLPTPLDENLQLLAELKDVRPGDWFYEGVAYCISNRYMFGYEDKRFLPTNKISRAELFVTVYRYAKINGKGFIGEWDYPLSFSDAWEIPQFASESIAWLTMKNIIGGYDDGTIKPNEIISREEIIALLYNFAKYMKYDTGAGKDINIYDYEDYADVSPECVEAFRWALGAGIVEKANKTLNPKSDVQRAEVAVILKSFGTIMD